MQRTAGRRRRREVRTNDLTESETTMTISTFLGTRILSGLGALAIAGSVAGGTAMAGNPERGEHEGRAEGREVAEFRHDLKERIAPEREAISELRRQLADEYAKANPDAAELRGLHDAIEAHRDAISDMKFEALMSMHDELDAEQRAKVAEHLAHGKHGGKGEGKKGKGEGKKGEGKKGKGKPESKGKPEKPEKDR
jgi:Spy/CpxP family protein refolding chaperone